MVSRNTIGAVDLRLRSLALLYSMASIITVEPEWMKRDLQGTADNLSGLAELGVGTLYGSPGAAMRGRPNASYADKAA